MKKPIKEFEKEFEKIISNLYASFLPLNRYPVEVSRDYELR